MNFIISRLFVQMGWTQQMLNWLRTSETILRITHSHGKRTRTHDWYLIEFIPTLMDGTTYIVRK